MANEDWKPIFNKKLKIRKPVIKLNAINCNIKFNAYLRDTMFKGFSHILMFVKDNILAFKLLKNVTYGSYSIQASTNRLSIIKSRVIFETLIDAGYTSELNGYFRVTKQKGHVFTINLDQKLKLTEVNSNDISKSQKVNKLHRKKSKRND